MISAIQYKAKTAHLSTPALEFTSAMDGQDSKGGVWGRCATSPSICSPHVVKLGGKFSWPLPAAIFEVKAKFRLTLLSIVLY